MVQFQFRRDPLRAVRDGRSARAEGEALREDQEEVALLDRLPRHPPRRTRSRFLRDALVSEKEINQLEG